jgi:hypothetical protein
MCQSVDSTRLAQSRNNAVCWTGSAVTASIRILNLDKQNESDSIYTNHIAFNPQAFVSLRRLKRFLSCPELSPNWSENSQGGSFTPRRRSLDRSASLPRSPRWPFTPVPSAKPEEVALFLKGVNCSWAPQDAASHPLVLRDVRLAVPKGALVVVLGKVRGGATCTRFQGATCKTKWQVLILRTRKWSAGFQPSFDGRTKSTAFRKVGKF